MRFAVEPRALLRAVAGWLRARSGDLLILASLIALGTVTRFLRLERIEIGSDAVQKWLFVRQWSYANDFGDAAWNHHMARFGMNAFAWVVQAFVDRGSLGYHVTTLIFGVLQVPFVYLVARRLDGRVAGALAGLLLIYSDISVHPSSQFLPEGFAG